MRKVIDAHAHITPDHQAGMSNAAFNFTFEPNGVMVLHGHAIQAMPEYVSDTSFTADTLIKVMDHHGVEKAMLMCAQVTNIDETAEAIEKYPGRFGGAMNIPQDESCFERIDKYYERGLTAIKFETSAVLGYLHPTMWPDFKFNNPLMKRVYKKCADMGITITIDAHHIGFPSYQVPELEEVTSEFPDTHFVICHIGSPDYDMPEDSDNYKQWSRMLALARKKNVWFDISAMPSFYRKDEYPYTKPLGMIRGLMDLYGAESFLWGSDVSSTLTQATYQQMIDMYARRDLFTEAEKDLIFYDNAVKAYHLG